MKKSKMFKLAILGFAAATLTACSGDDDDEDNNPPPSNDEELITDLRLTFTDTEGISEPQTFVFSDPDGIGGDAPTIDNILVTPGSYIVTIEVLDASDPNDIDDITAEIMEEDLEHQFFFTRLGSAVDAVDITYNDTDSEGNPVGLSTIWTSENASTGEGSVRVTLIHEPNKAADGIAIDNPGVAGGETDIEVDFNFAVQ